MRIVLPLLLATALPLRAADAKSPRIVAPEDGATVALLTDDQKSYLDMPRAARIQAFADADYRRQMRSYGYYPAKVRLEWESAELQGGVRPVYTVSVFRLPDGTPVFRADTTGTHLEVDNLEIAREYLWIVCANNGIDSTHSAGSRFRTEDRAPRLLRAPGVPNVRDLGGRIGLDGRRVRQGLVIRTAGLNENASDEYYTREETLARAADPDALLAREQALKDDIETMRGYQAEPGNLKFLSAPISPTWTVFRVAMSDDDFLKDGFAALHDQENIPEEFLGASSEVATLDQDGCFDFSEEDGKNAKGPAVFVQTIDFDEDGWISLGCGADWWWALLVNGEIVFDRTFEKGNEINPVSPTNHVFPVPVRKGRNLFAAVVRTGSAGWRWCCQGAPAESIATLLSNKIGNDERRIDALFRTKKGVKPGRNRIDDGNRSLFLDTLGIKSDIDLRSDGECYGMEGSPLGPTVTWFHISSAAYAGMQSGWGREAFTKVFRIFLDPANYPIDFHCIAGQDRTGAVAFIVNALLGVAEEELFLDWESTGFWNGSSSFNHQRLFNNLYHGFDQWPGATINERVEAYVLSLGFTRDDIQTLRDIMLEPLP